MRGFLKTYLIGAGIILSAEALFVLTVWLYKKREQKVHTESASKSA